MPTLYSVPFGLLVGVGLPHLVIGKLIKRRINKFNARFPDAIELMVRGLRSGLPISETIGIVADEIPKPVGIEFRAVSDKMRIGRTMDAALQETAERLGTAEFQFYVVSLAIQRETGGNLAETLSNLADVLQEALGDEAQDPGDVVGIEGVGLHHRRPAVHRLRADLVHQRQLHAEFLHRPAADDRRRHRPRLDVASAPSSWPR